MKLKISKHIKMMSLIALVALAASVKAQYISGEFDLSNYTGKQAIVRSVSSNAILMHLDNPNGSSNCFIYKDIDSPNGCRLKLIPETSVYGTKKYKINDMCIIGKMCYFCGQIIEPDEPVLPPINPFSNPRNEQNASMGIVGRFSLDICTANQTTTFDHNIVKIQNTTTLNRMDYSIYGADTVLAIIGLYDYNPSHTCVVSLQTSPFIGTINPGYKVLVSPSVDEVFTDVVATNGNIAVISRENTDNHTFYIRYDNWYDWHTLNPANLHWQYGFNLFPNDPYATDYTWRRPDADILACDIPGTNYINVAYECNMSGENSSTVCGAALFKMEISTSVSMSKAQYVHGIYTEHDCFKDIAYLPCDKSVALLYSNPYHDTWHSVVHLPCWIDTPAVRSVSIRDKSISSIDISNGQYINMGGIYTEPSGFVQLKHDKLMSVVPYFCQNVIDTRISKLETAITDASIQKLSPIFSKTFEWVSQNGEKTSASLPLICSF